jgi:hypothetical protein
VTNVSNHQNLFPEIQKTQIEISIFINKDFFVQQQKFLLTTIYQVKQLIEDEKNLQRF